MGDHRASVKVEFSMYGKTKKCDMWINWSPDFSDYHGVDQRVLDFFSNAAEEMASDYWAEIERAARKQQKKVEEENERKEYERLKTKFEGERHGNSQDNEDPAGQEGQEHCSRP